MSHRRKSNREEGVNDVEGNNIQQSIASR